MTRAQTRAIRDIRSRHTVERVVRDNTPLGRVFVYANDVEPMPYGYAAEIVVYPDGTILGDNFDRAGFMLGATA